ncbi:MULTISPECIES: MFS transporter [Sporomusa]|jgi:ACS family tartrate transporter-like MFS transporter|uniref:MFS transporter n=1 Tax=Sporomusa TaxID=2375 RepID=UPI001668F793|nr:MULTISPECIES: MFS transporter [Sporomusa]MCM0757626.1 MFS transporter [Sporomusa sphaeroides DSM 2875]
MNDKVYEKSVINKVTWRLIPFLVLSYLLCYIDRVNLGFAALTMNKELGFSATVFGWGAGLLFVGYFLFEVPSNLALQRFGARIWIARIMITWGIISAAMALIQGTVSFYVMRFLLGAAEAGFFPGIILYLTYWFPAEYRGVIISRFMFAQPIALMLGSAISGWLLNLDGVWGISGWKWMFVLEGLPSVLLGIVTLFYLTDKPEKAEWLKPDERKWLQARLDAERSKVEAVRKYGFWETLLNPRVLLLGFTYVCIVIGIYGVNMWLPQIVKTFSSQLSNTQIGLISAIPFVSAAIGMLFIGISSDHFQERKWHLTITTVLAGLTLLASAYTGSSSPAWTIFFLSVSSICLYGCMPIFWTYPPAFLTGTAAAAGIALINSIGNLGGFAGPFAVGWIKDTTGDFLYGLIFLGFSAIIGALVAYIVCTKTEQTQAKAAVSRAESVN